MMPSRPVFEVLTQSHADLEREALLGDGFHTALWRRERLEMRSMTIRRTTRCRCIWKMVTTCFSPAIRMRAARRTSCA